MSLRTPLSEAQGLGSAKSGTEHFWRQRMTAIANVPLVIFLLWFIVSHLGAARGDVVASVQNPFNAILLVLSFVSILWHMRLGMQTVIEDYVHGHAAKLVSLVLNNFYIAALGVAAFYAILKMGFGS
jgi:succinate dehydrogenase / fumarate reductase membrane anchor subunit